MRRAVLVLIVMLLLSGLQGCGGVSATTSLAPAETAGDTLPSSVTEEPVDTVSPLFTPAAPATPSASPDQVTTAVVTATTGSPTLQPTEPTSPVDGTLDRLAEDTWAYLSSDWATANHLPWSWRSEEIEGGDYANTAEISLYALSWLAAHDLQRSWSPTWIETKAEVIAVLDQLRAWQTGAQEEQPHGPNAYEHSVFYQWYWISWTPPVVGENVGDNHVVPSVDNAWLVASLITIREYAEANDHGALAQKANEILGDMDFMLWYHPDTHRFTWGDVEDPQGGTEADYYSNENRIINFVARALGQLSAEEFKLSLDVLERPAGTHDGIAVEKMAWDGSYFTYASPALFIREMDTGYGANTITPATQAQMTYALDEGYDAWGLSDCYDVDGRGYVKQGAPPTAMSEPAETRPGLVSPHASALALITPLAPESITNLQTISNTLVCAYDPSYGFLDSVMANPAAPDYGHCSERFSALAQEWIFLAIANHETDFIWEYFYQDEGVAAAHIEMFGESSVHLPIIAFSCAWSEAGQVGAQDARAGLAEVLP